MHLQQVRDRIQQLMNQWIGEVKAESLYGQNDKKVVSENVVMPLLKELCGYKQLRNLNAEGEANYPAIDLGDKEAGVAVQVTATAASDKITSTLEKFIQHEHYTTFKRLIIYILTEKQQSYTAQALQEAVQKINQHINFDLKRDIWDASDIHKRVAGMDVNQAQRVLQVLEDNFGSRFDRKLRDLFSTVPPLRRYVQREQLYSNLKTQLLSQQPLQVVGIESVAALRGTGGFGKTTLAVALCHDPDIRRHFADGIFWVQVNERATLDSALPKLNDLTRFLTPSATPVETLELARGRLKEHLKNQRLLLVIDDAWTGSVLKPFLDLNCTLLITTRRASILPEGCEAIQVDTMTAAESIETLLLNTDGLLPTEADNVALEQLARRVGYWPVLLGLIGPLLKKELVKGRSLTDAIARVDKKFKEVGITALDNLIDDHDRNRAVTLTLKVSLETLPSDPTTNDETAYRRRFEQLAIFPEDIQIPLSVLKELWAISETATETTVEQLHDAGLLREVTDTHIRLHDVIRSYLIKTQQANLAVWHSQLIDNWRPVSGNWRDLAQDNNYAWHWFAYHLHGAGLTDELRNTLLDYDFLQHAIHALPDDLPAIVSLYGYLQDTAVTLIRRALQLSSHVLVRNPEQLPFQLVGRLLGDTDPDMNTFLRQAKAHLKTLGLSPLAERPFLMPPGPLEQIIEVGSGVEALLALNSSQIVSGSDDGIIRIWNIVSGKSQVLDENTGRIIILKALDTERIISGSMDGTVRLWNVTSGASQVLGAHAKYVTALTVLDGRHIISRSIDKTVRLWDIVSGESTVFEDHENPITALTVLNSEQIITGTSDGTVCLWNVTNGESQVLVEHVSPVTALAASGSKRVISGSRDGNMRIWNVENSKSQVFGKHTSSVTALTILDDERIVSGLEDGSVVLWNVVSGQSKVLGKHTRQVFFLAELGSEQIISRAVDGIVGYWNLANGESQIFGEDTGKITFVTALTNNQIVFGTQEGYVRLWNVVSGELQVLGQHAHWVSALAVLDKERVISGSDDGTIRIWDIGADEALVLQQHADCVSALTVLDKKRVISGSDNGTMRIWNIGTGETEVLGQYASWVSALTALDSNRVISMSWDGTVRLWNVVDGQSQVLGEHKGSVTALAVLDSERVISATIVKPMRIWNVVSGESRVLGKVAEMVTALAIIDSKRIVCGAKDGTVRLWNVAKEEMRVLGQHADWVSALAVLDGERIISMASDGTVYLWNVASGESQLVVQYTSPVSAVTVLNGEQFISMTENKTMQFWNIKSSEEYFRLDFDETPRVPVFIKEMAVLAVVCLAGSVFFFQLEPPLLNTSVAPHISN